MPGYEAEMADFERYDAQVVGISVDSVPSHVAFAKSLGGIEKYPLLADFHPKGLVSKKYGVWKEDKGICERAVSSSTSRASSAISTCTTSPKLRKTRSCSKCFGSWSSRSHVRAV